MSKTNENVIEHVTAEGRGNQGSRHRRHRKADAPTDRVLAWIEKSGISVVIVGAYSVGMVWLGSYLF